MSNVANFIAVDLGASSGRVMLGGLAADRFTLHELHRFPNSPVSVGGHLYWDVLRIWEEIKTGIARSSSANPVSIGIDSWAIDYGLLDSAGRLLGNPYAYRDHRTDGMIERVGQIVPLGEIYATTGIQHLPINTLYQLASMRFGDDPQLLAARKLLLMPDLLGYWLTGTAVAEYTNATTTEFFDARARTWATDLLARLDLPAAILPPIVQPGHKLGNVRPEIRRDVGLTAPLPVITVATHDTASAVAAIPGLDQHSAYISSGTWSLVGIETAAPILTEQAAALNFTNEGGVEGTIRFLKNVGGLWLLQECAREWNRNGDGYGWPELLALAETAPPLQSAVDPDAPEFLNPQSMTASIRDVCRRTGQPVPASVAELTRCCLESLALKYRWVVEALEKLSGNRINLIRVVGGGAQNALLCQLTADCCSRQVVAGPVEATALGNVMVQAIAGGYLPNVAAGRQVIAASFQTKTYRPHPSASWEAAYNRFAACLPGID